MLLNKLRVQAEGMGGLLDRFWPDVRDSAWIGGKAEGWERGPYWLDGFIPLAILLDEPDLKARARRWVDRILSTQRNDGWLGPDRGNPDPESRLADYDVWPRFIVLKALTQWHEATGDSRVIPAMTRFVKLLGSLLDRKPLDEWARVRWADLVLSIHRLYDRTGDRWLLDVADKARRQGLDWPALASDFPYREKVTGARLEEFKRMAGGKWINDQLGGTHGVNVAMGLKVPGVWYRQSGAEADRRAAGELLAALDRFHGQATGMFTRDQHLAGLSPSQRTELCTVVEAMFSLEVLLAIMGDPALADRLERIAFNALPAPFDPAMTAHQYVQQANQAVCKLSQERVYTNNGPDANIFGLEPHFGCCTANFHQGRPKFAANLWMASADGGLAAVAYAPCDLTAQVGGRPIRVEVRTEYPFREIVGMTVRAGDKAEFPLHLRIPAWAEGAEVTVGNRTEKAQAGTFQRLALEWVGDTEVTLRLPAPVALRNGCNNSVSVVRGPLVFALRVGAEWRKLRQRGPFADWEVHSTAPWNYALDVDRGNPAGSIAFAEKPVGNRPFSPNGAPLEARDKGRRVPLGPWSGTPPRHRPTVRSRPTNRSRN